jgi:autotransporter-associated beta strand protein
LQGVTGNSSWAGNVTFTANDTRIGVQDGANLTVSGNISDGGANLRLVLRHGSTTAGSITLSGTGNSWTGGTDVFGGAGAVILGADNALGSGLLRVGAAGVGTTSTLDLNGNDQTSAGLSQGNDALIGVVRNDGASPSLLTLNPSTGQIYRGVIQDGASTVAVTINGSSVQTLSGANNYTGATTVSGGTLRLSSSGSLAAGSAVTVNGTGTLGGDGTVNGAVTVQSGATLAPGTGVGQLTLGSTLTFNIGATAHCELTNGLAADKAAASGAVTYAGKLKLERAAGATLDNGSYDLFDGASFSGVFTQLELVNWDATKRVNTNNLVVDGSITLAANAAPVAQNRTLGVAQGDSASLLIIGGKNAPTDADGDALSVTSAVLVTPANGGGVSIVGGTSVVYTASASFSGTDSFTYTVSDPFGATDTKTVTVEVAPAGTGANITGISGASPTITVTAQGVPNAVYQLQYTTNLTTVNWGDVSGAGGTATASALTGAMTFTDANATNSSAWYRTRHVSGP